MQIGLLFVLCLTLPGVHSEEVNATTATDDTSSTTSDWGLGSIRDSFETVNGYFDSFLELLGGKNGVCQYKCRYGKWPKARKLYASRTSENEEKKLESEKGRERSEKNERYSKKKRDQMWKSKKKPFRLKLKEKRKGERKEQNKMSCNFK
uniref:Pla2g12b protein n=1 Tax=Callorhinchus milii TaxID=7868 RepID=V9LII4_CALMI